MKYKTYLLAVAAGLTFTVTANADTIVITEPQARMIVTEAGYGEPISIVKEGELWRVVSPSEDSPEQITLFVNSKGEVVGAKEVSKTRVTETSTTTTIKKADPASVEMTEALVAQIVMDAGYHNVHDIDYLDGKGVWKAEADDASGEDYELHVSPITHKIVHVEDD